MITHILAVSTLTSSYTGWGMTRQDGQMSRESIYHFGRLRNPNLMCSNVGQVKPMTLKLIFVTSQPGMNFVSSHIVPLILPVKNDIFVKFIFKIIARLNFCRIIIVQMHECSNTIISWHRTAFYKYISEQGFTSSFNHDLCLGHSGFNSHCIVCLLLFDNLLNIYGHFRIGY